MENSDYHEGGEAARPNAEAFSRIYIEARRVLYGETSTYGELAPRVRISLKVPRTLPPRLVVGAMNRAIDTVPEGRVRLSIPVAPGAMLRHMRANQNDPVTFR